MGSNQPSGYWQKILRIDLTRRKIIQEEISLSVLQKLMGGAGFGAKILYDEVGSEVSPLHPDDRLIFALGPMQATNITGSAKFSVISRSPLTGIQADSAAGAHFGIELKKSGFDILIIQGKAGRPVYLWINDGRVQIKDASHLWGKDSYETTDAIRQELNDKSVSIAAIGKGGENQVVIACIVFDKHSFAGRCGLGAVMGSKNLKAIAVRGTKKVPVANPEKVKELTKKLGQRVANNAKETLRAHGTPGALVPLTEMGDTPIKNWTGDIFEGASRIGAPYYTKVLNVKPLPCVHCTVGCHRYVRVTNPPKYACEGAGPEYETLGMLGNLCLIDNVKAIAKANDMCNRYGLDTISTGSWAAFLMECYEKGLISKADTGGLEIKWSSPDVLLELIEKFAEKKGIGAIFDEGIRGAAEKIGGDAKDFAIHIKGLDLPAHDPRAFFSNYINYPTGNRGGCHERGDPQKAAAGDLLLPEFGISEHPKRFTLEGKVTQVIAYQDYSAIANSFVICKFVVVCGITLTDMLEIFNAVTGWDFDIKEFRRVGERVHTLQRLVNTKHYGVSSKDDVIPKRIFEPAKEGGRAGRAPTPEQVNAAIQEYYKYRGWDMDGRVTDKKLSELGL